MRRAVRRPRWIGWIFVGVGLALLVAAALLALLNLRYADAATTTGTVVEHSPSSTQRGNRWHVVVEWSDDGGLSHLTRSAAATSEPEPVGAQVPVEYLPGDPGSARVASWADKWLASTITGGIGIVFALVGAFTTVALQRGSAVWMRGRGFTRRWGTRPGSQADDGDDDGEFVWPPPGTP